MGLLLCFLILYSYARIDPGLCRHECRHGTHECVRHKLSWKLRNTSSARRPGRRAYLLITLFALLLVLFPFLFWYGTWFGRTLTDAQIEQYLNDSAHPRHAQHALVQIGERQMGGRPEVSRWYPKVMELARNPRLELRQTAAWIMGQDHRYTPFHDALRALLNDAEPTVRRNAALGLANFRDAAALPELHVMLRSWRMPSPAAGTLKFRLKAGEYVNPGTLVARIGADEVRSPLPGEVRALLRNDGATVRAGEELVELGPDEKHVWEALRALVLVGGRQDLDDVRIYARGASGMPDRIRNQALLTLQAIESGRSAAPKQP